MRIHFTEAPNNFYLGAQINPETGEVIETAPVYYDARDLTTHAVILGMTGSGKTGLAVTFLEEAVLDGIPSIIIDPKGDITNLLLAFPDLTPDNFLPWVNPEDATRADRTIEEQARIVATQWKEGLESWGIDNERIQAYRQAARFSIYTPGSEAGLQISILQSFAAPSEGWVGNEEMLRERISGIVTALLALIGITAVPVEDREHILLSNIFEYNWRNGVDLSMEQLILQVQKPPFAKLGVFDVESLFPEKDRFKLAQRLNNIIATPSFQNWINGEPLHVPSLLYTPEGYPRTTVFYVAHLNDAERQFIITLLLQEVLAWMRSLSGSTSLRAIIYIDEVFGMFPPYPRNPAPKEPLLRLLKQARAFGIGMMIATQNPADLDYKGLANAGTWIIGKMQTDNDRARVLEGLDSARDATSALDVRSVAQLIGRLGPRQFVMHNIHEPATPFLIHTRWSMSFLRGPLTREQISRLMAGQRAAYTAPETFPSYFTPPPRPGSEAAQGFYDAGGFNPPQAVAERASSEGVAPSMRPAITPPLPQAQPAEEEAPAGFSPVPPAIPSSVQQYYIPTEYAVEQSIRNWERWTGQPAVDVKTRRRLLYRPSLLAQVQVRFNHTQTNTFETLWYAFIVPNLPRVPYLDWSEYQAEPFDPRTLEPHPFATGYYAEVPPTLATGSGFKDMQSSLVDWLYTNARLMVYYNPALKLYSGLGESKRDFYARVQAAARDLRDAELDKVAERYEKKLVDLEDRAQQMALRLESERDEYEARKQEELLSAGESVVRLMKGNVYRTVSQMGRLRRFSSQSEDMVGIRQQQLLDLADRLEATEREMEQALEAVRQKWAAAARQIDEVPITPYKKDISFILFGIGWVPYWDVVINGASVILPASSSGLSAAQDPSVAGYYS